ncbi:nuclear transport factor 2 family protein [Yoonia maritima]|uniref:nuclear transport factor 2 family protein n=1 Tax=Yoonia maritima TaxID=1435347 RepID=UPI000D0F81AC|nr:nuclear transport factor 2 family protein [Yoonia maritima]
MADATDKFFAAWSMQDPNAQADVIAQCFVENGTYSDPRSGERLLGATAIANYVAMFGANAPGWGAKVTKSDNINNYTRAIVQFSGKGPDGQEMAQHGTYFVDTNDDGQIIAIAGFVGETPAD